MEKECYILRTERLHHMQPEVVWHSGTRPIYAVWQGKGWMREQHRKENIPKEFHGKEYTLYEAKQRQRQMETVMRGQREKVELLKKCDADPDDVMLARAKWQGQLNEYSRFCKKMGLTEEREHIYYDMCGRIASGRVHKDMIVKSSSTHNLLEKSKISKILGDDKEAVDFGEIDKKSKNRCIMV